MADQFELRLRAGLLDLVEGAPGEHPRWATSPAAARVASIAVGDQRPGRRLPARIGSLLGTRRAAGAMAWLAILAVLLALLGLALLSAGGRADRGLVLAPTPSPWLSPGLLVTPFVADAVGDVRVEPIDGPSSANADATQPPISPAIDITWARATVGAETLTIDVALKGEAGPEQYVVLVALHYPDRSPRSVEIAVSCDNHEACAPAPSTAFFEPVAFSSSIRVADGERVVSFVVGLDDLARASIALLNPDELALASQTPIGHGPYAPEVHTWLRAPLPKGWWFEDVAPEDGPGVPIPRGEAL